MSSDYTGACSFDDSNLCGYVNVATNKDEANTWTLKQHQDQQTYGEYLNVCLKTFSTEKLHGLFHSFFCLELKGYVGVKGLTKTVKIVLLTGVCSL